MVYNASKNVFRLLGGRPLITFAPRGRVGVKTLIHFHCVLHAKIKRGGGSR